MEYCRYCGRQLDKDGRCTCEKSKEEIHLFREEKSGRFKKILMITGISVIILIILMIAAMIISGVNAYKKPIKKLVKGMNKADTEMIMESLYNEDTITFKRVNAKNNGTSWKDYLEKNDKNIKSKLKNMGLKSTDYDIAAKEELSGSNLKEVRDFYKNEYEADVKKAYRVEVNFTFKTKGGNETPSGWICVVKLKDEGWKFCPEYSEKHFDFIDSAINFK